MIHVKIDTGFRKFRTGFRNFAIGLLKFSAIITLSSY
jgi:hypothetical protein